MGFPAHPRIDDDTEQEVKGSDQDEKLKQLKAINYNFGISDSEFEYSRYINKEISSRFRGESIYIDYKRIREANGESVEVRSRLADMLAWHELVEITGRGSPQIYEVKITELGKYIEPEDLSQIIDYLEK